MKIFGVLRKFCLKKLAQIASLGQQQKTFKDSPVSCNRLKASGPIVASSLTHFR